MDLKANTIFKTLSVITITICLILCGINPVYAQDISLITPSDVSLDTSSTREDANFSVPTAIVIAPVFSNADYTGLTPDEQYRGIYFYTVEMLGFNDIPYHYLVSENGGIYLGNKGRDERKIKIDGIGDNVVVIGYMTDKNSGKLSPDGKNALKTLTTVISNANSINPDNISIQGITFLRDQTSKTVILEKTEIFGSWQTDILEISTFAKSQYQPIPKDYNLKINQIISPTAAVAPGSEVTISVDVTNIGEWGIYGDSDSQIIFTKRGDGVSQFFLNNSWVSTTQVPLIKDDEFLLPIENSIFEINLKAPLGIGEISESFDVYTISGIKLDVEPVTFKLNLAPTNQKIVEIKNTETGTLNVRSAPSSVASSFTQVSPGERFFQTEDAGNGWIQIQLNDGQVGWIANWYVNYLN
ncbi:SH3 domain-containing protein [Candidatus Dojkabacteria bacterium]|uniref:SH3 domain-containing protein n=1 Tax=Candidatus Dojkabacteria bacterium TaxID=2099670 RepID=A0A955LAY9_9BACT|nr:SH3 domain-containing protein [Candidatus Dojkabacteria bacterium]